MYPCTLKSLNKLKSVNESYNNLIYIPCQILCNFCASVDLRLCNKPFTIEDENTIEDKIDENWIQLTKRLFLANALNNIYISTLFAGIVKKKTNNVGVYIYVTSKHT